MRENVLVTMNATYVAEETLARVSRVSGMLSLSVWLFAQLPQIIENHLNQSVDGVSLAFLLCWISGDTTNLLGCILTKALPFQTSLASYYCFIDCILSLQYWYYTRVYPKQRVHHNLLQSPNMMREHGRNHKSKLARAVLRRNRFEAERESPIDIRTRGRRQSRGNKGSFMRRVLSGTIVGSLTGRSHAHPLGKSPENSPSKKESHFLDILHQCSSAIARGSTMVIALVCKMNLEDVGKISAWLCTGFYLSLRSPQIVKNYRLASTKGISVYLFLFAMMGNLFYTISIVVDLYIIRTKPHFHKILQDQLPFIVGSSGTMVFDSIIIFQCWYYNRPVLSPQEFDDDSLSTPLHFQTPSWYQPTYNPQQIWEDDENTPLVPLRPISTYFESPPPHYIQGSLDARADSSGSAPSGVTSALRGIASSFKRESPAASPLPTNLIPSIIGSYSAVNKKFDSKTPFLPIDFLNDDFQRRVESGRGSVRLGRSLGMQMNGLVDRR